LEENRKKFNEPPKSSILLSYKQYLVYNEVIGTGTYSKVYMGYNLVTKTKVAVKEISELE
jgi:serine/threonine protein kinase